MGSAPIPPHERLWRHPSEVAAEVSHLVRTDQAPAGTRLLAVVTGTVGLLAIGALLMTITPRRFDAPTAISATTTPTADTPGGASLRQVGGASTRRASAPSDPRPLALAALATPVGDGRLAVVALAGSPAVGDRVAVRFASGGLADAVVDSTLGGLVVVSIPAQPSGHPIAEALPSADDIVTVLGTPPITVVFGDVSAVDAEPGTPILDANGDLVGLCTRGGGDETTMLDVIEHGANSDDGDPSEPGSAGDDGATDGATDDAADDAARHPVAVP